MVQPKKKKKEKGKEFGVHGREDFAFPGREISWNRCHWPRVLFTCSLYLLPGLSFKAAFSFFFIHLFILAPLSLPCSVQTFSSWQQVGATLCCGSRALGIKSFSTGGLQAQIGSLWCTGFVAPQHVESSQSRDRTCVPCVGRRILIHYATKKVPSKPLSAGILGLLRVACLFHGSLPAPMSSSMVAASRRVSPGPWCLPKSRTHICVALGNM